LAFPGEAEIGLGTLLEGGDTDLERDLGLGDDEVVDAGGDAVDDLGMDGEEREQSEGCEGPSTAETLRRRGKR
jgi:hypothetical protein